jgi:two-component system, OmpR family, osmolarity sensor histidine kinase EnvZ
MHDLSVRAVGGRRRALVFAIAALFMRNQVRAIRRLAAAAEAFGLGRESRPDPPEGATEVRRAATAFNRMQERIRRFLAQRTEMLAGVSHDLRTPLTRLRLLWRCCRRAGAARRHRRNDRRRRGDGAHDRRLPRVCPRRGAEQAEPVDLSAVLEDVAARARRGGADGRTDDVPAELTLPLRADAVRRAITNLVDNARRHARHVVLAAAPQGRGVQVTVDDDGPGIPPERARACSARSRAAPPGDRPGADDRARYRAWRMAAISCWRIPHSAACGRGSVCRCSAWSRVVARLDFARGCT